MKMIFYTIIFALILNECYAGTSCSKTDINKDHLRIVGDSIKFFCINDPSQRELFMVVVKKSIPSSLVDYLDNGKGLSILFHGVGSDDVIKKGFLQTFAKDWSIESGNNICQVAFPFKRTVSSTMDADSKLNELVTERSLEFEAKMASDLVLRLRQRCLASRRTHCCLQNLSQVDVSGFSFGAYMAGQTCKYLYDESHERVRMLLALDPSKTIPIVKKKPTNTISRDYADYVQVIHTSFVGIDKAMGDADIYVKFDMNLTVMEKHRMAFEIHMATATKRYYMYAEEGKSGTLVKNVLNKQNEPKEKHDNCLVGIYGTIGRHTKTDKGKTFKISLKAWDYKNLLYSGSDDIFQSSDGEIALVEELSDARGSQSRRR